MYSRLRPRLRPWERPRKEPCVVQYSWTFTVLFWEISRVITKTQLDVYTLDVLFLQTHLGSCVGCFVSLFPRFFPRSQQYSNILIIFYFILFYTSIVKVYTHCLFSAETSAKTSEGTMRCSAFMIVDGLISKISRVLQTFHLSYKQSNYKNTSWYLTLDVLGLCLVLFGVSVLLMVFFGKYRESLFPKVISKVWAEVSAGPYIYCVIYLFWFILYFNSQGIYSLFILRRDLGWDLGKNLALFGIHELLWSYFGKYREYYKNTIGCLYSRCFVFTDSFRFLRWLFRLFIPRS